MTPVAAGDTMLNAVIALSDERGPVLELHDARDKDKIIKNMRTKNKIFKILDKRTNEPVTIQLYNKRKSTWLVFPSVSLGNLTEIEKENFVIVEYEIVEKRRFNINKEILES